MMVISRGACTMVLARHSLAYPQASGGVLHTIKEL